MFYETTFFPPHVTREQPPPMAAITWLFEIMPVLCVVVDSDVHHLASAGTGKPALGDCRSERPTAQLSGEQRASPQQPKKQQPVQRLSFRFPPLSPRGNLTLPYLVVPGFFFADRIYTHPGIRSFVDGTLLCTLLCTPLCRSVAVGTCRLQRLLGALRDLARMVAPAVDCLGLDLCSLNFIFLV